MNCNDKGRTFEELAERNAELESRVNELEKELAALKGKEGHYRIVADFTNDWIYWIGPDGQYFYVSPSCERVTGYAPRAFFDDPDLFQRIIHPDDRYMLRQHISGEISDQEHPPLDFRIISAGGEQRWISHTCRPVYDRTGNFLGRRGSNRDITERKAIEEALTLSETRYHSMFEGISNCVAVYAASDDGQDFFIRDFNRAAEESSRVKREEIVGLSVQTVFPNVIEMGLMDVFRRVYRTGESEHHPVSQYHDRRINLWVENYVYKLPTGEIVALYEDLTEKKLAEERLRISEERLKLAFEGASDGLWDWDVPTGRVFFSPRYFTMLGYEPDELHPNFDTWKGLLHPDDIERTETLILKHMASGQPYNVEFRLQRKSGGWHWVLARGKVVEWDDQGKAKRMVGTHVDIQVQKTITERLRRHVEELEALNSISQSTTQSLSLDEAVEAALDRMMQTIAPDLLMLYLIENDKMLLKDLRAKGVDTRGLRQANHKEGECLCGLAAQNSEAQFSLNIHEDIRCTLPECISAGIRSYASLPLLSKGKTIGVLGLGSLRERDFSASKSFLQSVTALVSTGIIKARLHQEVLAYANELEAKVAERTAELTKYYNAVKHSHASIVITDVQGRIEYVNPSFSRLTGYTPEEARGRRASILKSSRHDNSFYEDMWKTLMDKKTWRGELCNMKKDGTVFWEDSTISPVMDANGRILNFVAIKEDITEKKEAEQALRESELRYKTVFNASHDGIVITDRLTQTFLFANESAHHMFGYEPGDLLGKQIKDIHPEADLSSAMEEFERITKNETGYAVELPCLTKAGQVIYCDISATLVTIDNRLCVMGFLRDVSERREAAKLREDINRIIQHDLKTPLNGIINLPELVLAEGNLSPAQKDSLGLIEESGRKMLKILNSSLNLYRMETGLYRYQPFPIDLARIIRRLSSVLRPLAAYHGVILDMTINGNDASLAGTLLIIGEELLLYSLLSNLLTNAVEASPKGGRVNLSVVTGDELSIEVHNPGAVPAPIRDRFFDKYVSHGKTKGTGLGTYSARLMAETMGGILTMSTSDETDETTVTLKLPLRQ